MPGTTGRFKRSDRLLLSRDYRRVAAQGERSTCRGFVMLVAPSGPNPTGRVRLGITTSRRVGNAVVRNRVRRAVRNWFRGARGGMVIDRDLVVIARPAAAELNASEIARELNRVAGRSDGLVS